MFKKRVPIAVPSLPPAEPLARQFRRLLRGAQLTNGPEVARLEEQAAAYLGMPECVAVSSCTSGLMLVERVLGLEGEVIVPSFTFFATAHTLLWNNLTPVLTDCDPWSFNLDPERVEAAVTPRTSAILGVHIFGCPAPVKELSEIAERFGLRLLFDGAHAFGSRVEGRGIAAWGDATVFSLTPTKPLAAAEGGLIATRDPDLARKLRRARNYGKPDSNLYDCDILGLNARMTELQAVLATAGLPYVEAGVERRNELARIYESRLSAVPGLRLQRIDPRFRSSRKDFALVIDQQGFGLSRRDLQRVLDGDNIETRAYFDPPLHRQRLYRSYYRPKSSPLPVTDEISSGVLCLPLYADLPVTTAAAIADRVGGLAAKAAGEHAANGSAVG